MESNTRRANSLAVLTAAFASCGLACVSGCSAGAPSTQPSPGAPRADVVTPPTGVDDRGDDPAVVAVDRGGPVPCAGALIAPDVVLTAFHCVAVLPTTIDCARPESFEPSSWSLLEAASIRVLVGNDTMTAVERARGRAIIAPPDPTPCASDIALLLLDQPIDEIKPLVVRATGAARGDRARTVGFGRLPGTSIATKVLRDHVAVIDTTRVALEVAESLLDEGGGPLLDETTIEVVGVASRNEGVPSRDVYARADSFASLIGRALAASETAAPTARGQAKPKKGPPDMGANCARGADCAAGVCVSAATNEEQYCSRPCAVHDRCPTRFVCERTSSGYEVCVRH